MAERIPAQPRPDRLTHFAGHPIVVGVLPGQSELVALTAASLARATNAPAIYFGYVDTARFTAEEFADGTVRHEPIDPDIEGGDWMVTRDTLTRQLTEVMAGQEVPWHLRYLAGRVDRALTHLARAVDAAAFVIGTHRTRHRRVPEFLQRSIGLQLSHRQHRPVLVVPLQVVDWKGQAPWE